MKGGYMANKERFKKDVKKKKAKKNKKND